jgi:surface polysaccharide O-acyltransferase-like enzyme
MPPVAPVERRADLDWLRVLAFGLLIFYHAGMAWSGWSWHVTSPHNLDGLREAMRFLNRWRMPLIFLVSGAAILLALGDRTPGTFVRDRLKRLLLPLVFGMVVIVPPQVYLERLSRGQFTGSFLQWLPQAFDGVYPKGNLSWHHLWFVAYVLVLTLVLLPVFLWARSASGRAAVTRTGAIAARYRLQWLMVLPLAASTLWLAPVSWNVNGLVGDWHGLVSYGVLLLYGAFIFGSPDLLRALQQQRFVSLLVGIAAYAFLYVCFFEGTVRPVIEPPARPVFALLSGVNVMAWLFAIVGFAHRHLTRRPAFLAEATEAVYPFYLLHQTVTVLAVYWLLKIGALPLPGFMAAVLLTFAGTWAIYAGLVRPWRWIRPLFGMKPAVASAGRSLPRRAAGL